MSSLPVSLFFPGKYYPIIVPNQNTADKSPSAGVKQLAPLKGLCLGRSFCLILPIARPQSLWNLMYAKKLRVNDKIRDSRQRNMSLDHYHYF